MTQKRGAHMPLFSEAGRAGLGLLAGVGAAAAGVLAADPPVTPDVSTLSMLNFLTNAGAFGLLTVIVVWLGPKVFRDWTAAHQAVGDQLDIVVTKLVQEQQRRQEMSQANIMAFIQREKDSFDRREERMYQMMEKNAAGVAEALRTQTAALVSLREVLTSAHQARDRQA